MSHSQIKETDFEPIHYEQSDAERIAGKVHRFGKMLGAALNKIN